MKKEIKQILSHQIQTLFPGLPADFYFDIEYPKDEKFGDISTNAAMRLAPLLKSNPLTIAEKIKENLQSDTKIASLFVSIDCVRPGFLNFCLNASSYEASLEEILKSPDHFGKSNIGGGKKILLEFISANPTGPIHLGNGRSAFFGDTLSNIFRMTGYEVTKEYYLNDRGVQIETLADSVVFRLLESQGKEATKPESMYEGMYVKDIAAQVASELHIPGDSDAEEIKKWRERIRDAALDMVIKSIKDFIENKLHVHFDNWFSEKDLYTKEYIDLALKFLEEKDLSYKKDGATWMKTQSFGDDKDRVLIKSDGETTYFLSDIAYHWHKLQKRKFDRGINILGADHHGYVGRLQAGVSALGYAGKLEIIIMQLVKLMKGGKEQRMSKRSGSFVTLEELIDEVGTDVARFFFLMHDVSTPMDFDLDLAKERSEKNPVFYVQYAHARINSILTMIREKNLEKNSEGKAVLQLQTEQEKNLAREIVKLPEIIEEISANYQTQLLPNYTLQLARSFHNFYSHNRVIEEDTVNLSRLKLIQATQVALKTALTLMGITAPEKM